MTVGNKLGAELLGTFGLVLGGRRYVDKAV